MTTRVKVKEVQKRNKVVERSVVYKMQNNINEYVTEEEVRVFISLHSRGVRSATLISG